MNLTSKSRYALKIMMDLAHFGATQPLVRRNEIAIRQGVPTDYLDQIMIRLRAGNLVESIRGRSGGYRLAREASKITMWDLFATVEETMVPVECITTGKQCNFEFDCSSKDAWGRIFCALKTSLSTITLDTLAQDWAVNAESKNMGSATYISNQIANVCECRSGGSVHIEGCRAGKSTKASADGATIDG